MRKKQKEWTKMQKEHDLNTKSANAFGGTFVFFSTHKATQKKSKEPPSQRTTPRQTMDRNTTTDRRPACNSGFKKLAVQWLIEHSTSHQHLWWLDSFVLRNRQLLKPAKR